MTDKNRALKITGATLNQTPLDWSGNLRRIKEVINKAEKGSTDVLVFPELAITSYGCEDLFLQEWFVQKAWLKLLELTPFVGNMLVVVGLPIAFSKKVYNCVAIIHNQKIKAIVAKHHLANDGVHYETRWFASWPMNQKAYYSSDNQSIEFGSFPYTYLGVKIGFEICEDAWNSDRPACFLKNENVQLIINPSASHFAFEKSSIRRKLVVDSSLNFDCLYVYVNQLGNEAGKIIYDGDIIIAANGYLLANQQRFSYKEYELCEITYDFHTKESTSCLVADEMDTLSEFSRVVPLALWDYLRKSGHKGFVLSLSGGADSGTIAVLVHLMIKQSQKALGDHFFKLTGLHETENPYVKLLITAYQSTKNSSVATAQAARALAMEIGSQHYEWSVQESVDHYTRILENAIKEKVSWDSHDIVLQNIQARSRSPIIWMLANYTSTLLLTTSNRSEGAVGYATMDGDTSGGLAPIAGVSKAFIKKWLQYAEETLGYKSLKYIRAIPPTAELRPQNNLQTDEQDLMPYSILSEIEKYAILNKLSPQEVYSQLRKKYPDQELKQWVIRYFKLWSRNQWKRERLAPSFHLDEYSLDPRSWYRFPILSAGYQEEIESLEQME